MRKYREGIAQFQGTGTIDFFPSRNRESRESSRRLISKLIVDHPATAPGLIHQISIYSPILSIR